MFLRSWGMNASALSFHSNLPSSRDHFKTMLFHHFGGGKGEGGGEPWRAPVMIDDTIKAYAVLGIGGGSSPSLSSTPFCPDSITHILRFDPHAVQYPTGEDEVGWRGAEWMTFEVCFFVFIFILSFFLSLTVLFFPLSIYL